MKSGQIIVAGIGFPPDAPAIIEPVYIQDVLITDIAAIEIIGDMIHVAFDVQRPAVPSLYGISRERVVQVRIVTPCACFPALVERLTAAMPRRLTVVR